WAAGAGCRSAQATSVTSDVQMTIFELAMAGVASNGGAVIGHPTASEVASRGDARPTACRTGMAALPRGVGPAKTAHDGKHVGKTDGLAERRHRFELGNPLGFDARQHHDRNASETGVQALFLAERPPVHHRHAEIEDDDARIAAS